MNRLVLAAALVAASPALASASVLMECEEPRGQLYAVGTGWVEDGFTGGKFSLVQDGDNFDLFITDAVGSRSAISDGATIVPTEFTPTSMTLVAVYPNATESYLFDFANKKMVMTNVKISVGPPRGAVYQASCN